MKDHRYNRAGCRVNKSHLLAWAAGFFDGEGYVGVRKGNSGPAVYLSACVAQKDRRLLIRFRSILEFGNVGKPAKKSGGSYIRFTNSLDVFRLFEMLASYLGPQKTEQFEQSFAVWFAHKKVYGRVKL